MFTVTGLFSALSLLKHIIILHRAVLKPTAHPGETNAAFILPLSKPEAGCDEHCSNVLVAGCCDVETLKVVKRRSSAQVPVLAGLIQISCSLLQVWMISCVCDLYCAFRFIVSDFGASG